MTAARPLLKWAGGKTRSLDALLPHVPLEINTYHEPFVGGGALFFALAHDDGTRQIKNFVLSDANRKLIETYVAIRDDVDRVISMLEAFAGDYNRSPEKAYYELRAAPVGRPYAEAARFIAQNKTCFNGLYRVNSKGGFNVPWGKRETFSPDNDNLRACSVVLQGVEIKHRDFSDLIVSPGDVIYCDPPYLPVSASSNFTKYTEKGFVWTDQERLRHIAMEARKHGATVILSNANRPEISDLYNRDFKVEVVQVGRGITNTRAVKRPKVGELIITGGPL
jgi:DNA adenine methylase